MKKTISMTIEVPVSSVNQVLAMSGSELITEESIGKYEGMTLTGQDIKRSMPDPQFLMGMASMFVVSQEIRQSGQLLSDQEDEPCKSEG